MYSFIKSSPTYCMLTLPLLRAPEHKQFYASNSSTLILMYLNKYGFFYLSFKLLAVARILNTCAFVDCLYLMAIYSLALRICLHMCDSVALRLNFCIGTYRGLNCNRAIQQKTLVWPKYWVHFLVLEI